MDDCRAVTVPPEYLAAGAPELQILREGERLHLRAGANTEEPDGQYRRKPGEAVTGDPAHVQGERARYHKLGNEEEARRNVSTR